MSNPFKDFAKGFGQGVGAIIGIAGVTFGVMQVGDKEMPTKNIVLSDFMRPEKKDLRSVPDCDTTFADGSVGKIYKTDTVTVRSDRQYPKGDLFRGFVAVGDSQVVIIPIGDTLYRFIFKPETETYATISAITMFGEEKKPQKDDPRNKLKAEVLNDNP